MKKLYFTIIFLSLYITTLLAQDLTGVRICVNPGHGGFDSDDRNIVIYPYKTGDPEGFWESQSNLDKGLYLTDLLLKSGAEVILTRNTNFTEDDLALSVIVAMANAYNSDYMLSIHSNAGVNNYILMLCSGKDPGDTYTYNDIITDDNERISREVGEIVAAHLYTNEASCWYSSPTVRGDKTFARTAMGWSNGYGVLRGLSVPGMISEGAMHDYIPETYRLMNMDYKHMEAWYFFKSFCDYFDGGEQKIGKVAGWVKDKWNSFNDAFPISQNYYYQRGTNDEYMPVSGVKVSILTSDEAAVIREYTTDEMYNGFFMLDSIQPGNYKLKFERQYYSTLIQEVTVNANTITYANTFLEKDRSEPLAIKSYSPDVDLNTPVSCGLHISFNFNFEVDSESFEQGFHISPAVTGTFEYEQYQRTAIFIPDAPLNVNTKYTVKLDKEVKHIGNLGMEDDFTFEFITKDNNVFELVDWYPKDGDEGIYPNSLVKFYFSDQLMSSAVPSQFFSLVDKDGNEQTQNGTQLNAYPGELGTYTFRAYLEPNTTYTLKMDPGIKSADSLFVTTDHEITFTTGSENIFTTGQIDDFEERDLFTIDMDQTLNINSAVTVVNRYSSLSITGSRSYQVYYEFTKDEAYITANYVAAPSTVVNGDNVGIYIYGDLSYNLLNLIVSDGSNEEIFSFGEIDYSGWTYQEVSINGLEANKEYEIKGFQLVSSGTIFSKGGLILLDNMVKYDPTSIGNINLISDSSITFYPNPVEDFLFFDFPEGLELEGMLIRIMSLEGNIMKEFRPDLMRGDLDVSSLVNGLYLISFISNDITYNTILIKK